MSSNYNENQPPQFDPSQGNVVDLNLLFSGLTGNRDERQLLHQRIQQVETALDRLKTLLKTQVRAFGTLAVKGEQWEFKTSYGWKAEDLAPLANAINDRGLKPLDFFSLSANNVKDLMESGFTEFELKQLGVLKRPTGNPAFRKTKTK